MKNVIAFSFAAAEFLEEEIDEIEHKFGKIQIITDGVYKHNPESSHPHEWHTTQEAVNEINELLSA